MKQIRIGDITIDAVIEREGPWRRPQDFFPAYDEATFKRHLPLMEPEVFDAALGMMCITYQTFVVRSPRHTILVDTCTGEDKGHPAAVRFSRQGTLAQRAVRARRQLREKSTTCSAPICISTTPAGTPPCATVAGCRPSRTRNTSSTRRNTPPGKPRTRKGANPPGTVFRDNCLPIVEAGQALLVDDDYALDDTITLTPTPGHSPCHCCVNIFSRGQRAVVTGDMMHHAIQCRELDWSPGVDWDPKQAAVSRRTFLSSVADTDTLLMPIHFPKPTAGLVTADGDRFNYRFKRD